MISLSQSAIYYAVMKCVETANYHIIIAVSTMSKMQRVFDICMEAIERFNFDKPASRMSKNQFSMVFDNGSLIQCIPANDNARGHASHLVIYDYTISDDIRNNVLRCIEKWK